MSNKFEDKIRILDISIQMKKAQYEETVSRAARIDQKIRQLIDRKNQLVHLKEKGNVKNNISGN